MIAKRAILMCVLLFFNAAVTEAQPANVSQSPSAKYAQVLVHYSLDLQPGETLLIWTSPVAQELNLAVYREAIEAGAYPYFKYHTSEEIEIFFHNANIMQLTNTVSVDSLLVMHFNRILMIDAAINTKYLSSVDPLRLNQFVQAYARLNHLFDERIAKKELKLCYTTFPTDAYAQEAEMGSIEYKEFAFNACKLNEPNPESSWRELSKKQDGIVEMLKGKRQIKLKGPDIDLTFSIEGRIFLKGDGRVNFPDGEIYCSPVENSVNGWTKFSYPVIFGGREIRDVELWFENGKVIKEKASKGQDFLSEMLNTDEGSRILGEFGIGTNYNINKFTKNMLYDEKIGGTIHLAVGTGFPESGGTNKSAIHFDFLCDMSKGEIIVDREIVYKNGKFVK